MPLYSTVCPLPANKKIFRHRASTSPIPQSGLSLWLRADAGVTTSTITPTYISQIIISESGDITSDGTYTRTSGGNTTFTCINGNSINSNSLQSWYLYDATLEVNTYGNNNYLNEGSWYQLDGTNPPPSATNTISSGTPYTGVTYWYDQSGNSSNGTTNSYPTYSTSGLNSKPEIVFNGIQNYMNVPTSVFQGNSTFNIFYVFRMLGDGTNDGYNPSLGILSDSDIDQGAFHYVKSSSRYPASYPFYDGGNVPYGFYDLNEGNTYEDNGGHLVEFRSNESDSDNWEVYNKTNLESGNSINSTPPKDVGGIKLASQLSPLRFSNIGISEIIIYNRVVTSTEREQIQSYLNTKYGIY